MKKTKFIWLFSLIVLFSLSFAACGDDDKEDEKPEPNGNGTENNTHSTPTDGIFVSQLDSVLKAKSNAVISECDVKLLDEIPDYKTLRTALNKHTDVKVNLNMELCTGIAGIKENAFEDTKTLISVKLPAQITSIENGAFRGCSELKSIVIPPNVTAIGNAFSRDIECITLQSTTPPSMSRIQDGIGISTISTTVFVPENAVETYKNDKVWGYYYEKQIVAIGQDPIKQEDVLKLSATINGNVFSTTGVTFRTSVNDAYVTGTHKLADIFGESTSDYSTISGRTSYDENGKTLALNFKGTKSGTYELNVASNKNITDALIDLLSNKTTKEIISNGGDGVKTDALVIYHKTDEDEGGATYYFSTEAKIQVTITDFGRIRYVEGTFTATMRNKSGDTFTINDGIFKTFAL